MTGAMTETVTETEETTDTEYGWRVTLFNCECHTFDEVERQLIKATACSISQARSISNDVHTKGCAIVFEGSAVRCESVAGVLEDIRLIVKVSQ
ncbi:MAG: Clp protease ClpS [Elusimicrobia bacterium]|nr:MAG: Clp protease ClpS [Elusimicrobiota bacterium]